MNTLLEHIARRDRLIRERLAKRYTEAELDRLFVEYNHILCATMTPEVGAEEAQRIVRELNKRVI